jgi:ABC-type branched-subunit amino acid transport system substrate-binding protein
MVAIVWLIEEGLVATQFFIKKGETMKTAMKIMLVLVLFFAVNFIPVPPGRAADYVVSESADFTGPFATTMRSRDDSRKVFIEWWNETKGSALGIKLERKTYETRYDSSIAASLWPRILASDKPIAHHGIGISDVTALMARLPSDKVPLYNDTPASRVLWAPNQWVFHLRPTYIHETAAFLSWARKTMIKNRPVRFGAFEFKVPAGMEINEGHIKLGKEQHDWVEYLGAEWVDMKPVSVVSEMRRMARNKPDFLRMCGNTAVVIAMIKAQKELGIHIPIFMASQNGIQMTAKAAGDIKLLEGHYDVYACDPAIDPNIPGAKIFEEYKKKMGLTTTWDLVSAGDGAGTLLICRAIERAAAKVGINNITGEAVYNAMFEGPFTKESMLGLANNVVYTKEAAFPLTGLKVSVTTVKNGKQVLISDNIPLVEVPKW